MRVFIILSCFTLLINSQNLTHKTVFESIEILSPLLYHHLVKFSNTSLVDILHKSKNITFFLPDASFLNHTIVSNHLKNPNNLYHHVYDAFSFMIINDSLTVSDLGYSRQLYTSLDPYQSEMSIGPMLNDQFQATNQIEIYSGITKGKILVGDLYCKNGVIHVIDNFLQPIKSPIDTLSELPSTEYMEELIKSFNLTDTISKPNRTVLIPVNQAWEFLNRKSLPYGTILHHLEYMSFEGIYTAQQLFSIQPARFKSDYQHTLLSIGYDHGLVVNNVSRLVMTDILTTEGIFHLVDVVLKPVKTPLSELTSGARLLEGSIMSFLWLLMILFFFIS